MAKKKQEVKLKEPVRIRFKQLAYTKIIDNKKEEAINLIPNLTD